MRLRTKIQKSMIAVIATTLVIAYAMTTFVVYQQTIRLMENEVRQEAAYIQTAIDVAGLEYLSEMDSVQENTRITLIDTEGKVLYDTKQDDVTLENHKDRPEIVLAFQNGAGQDIRKSDTLEKSMFYYAVKFSDKYVLRVSKTMDTALFTAVQILPGMGLIAVIMLILAVALAKRQVEILVKPVNTLDLENPLENETYEEFTPLLESMDKQNREKEAVANMRKEFSANVSHELKTPLTSISGYAEIMKSGLVKPEDMGMFADTIYHEASRLIKLVEDIMELSKLDEGKASIEKETVNLYGLTKEIILRLAPLAEKRGIRVELTGESVEYYGVRPVLDEMIYNICENAIKYNKENGNVFVWIGKTLQGTKLIVRDTGIGIPKEEHERIFERFYRVDKSHSKETGGTGLGLSIVKHAAILHNIKVNVESEIGQGTKMELLF